MMAVCETYSETTGRPKLISKGWGFELIFVNKNYCGKLLHFISGKRCSLHSHKEKDEHFALRKGKMDIYYFDGFDILNDIYKKYNSKQKIYDCMERVKLKQGMTFSVPPGRVHQMIALEDSELYEFSTHDEPEDSYRIFKGD